MEWILKPRKAEKNRSVYEMIEIVDKEEWPIAIVPVSSLDDSILRSRLLFGETIILRLEVVEKKK